MAVTLAPKKLLADACGTTVVPPIGVIAKPDTADKGMLTVLPALPIGSAMPEGMVKEAEYVYAILLYLLPV